MCEGNMRIIIATLLLLSLGGCGERLSPTLEEKVFFQVLSRIEIAFGYQRNCVTDSKEINVNLYGNAQHIVYRLAGEIASHAPKSATDDEKKKFVDSRLKPYTEKIRADIDKVFKEKGCLSKEAVEAEKLYDAFSKIHPAQFHYVIQTEIEKQKVQGNKAAK